jgi:hypothetical protein
MMGTSMKLLAITLALAACTKAPAGDTPNNRPGLAPPTPPAPTATATVTLTSVAFADDCGGTPPWNPPAAAVPASPPVPASTPAPATRRAPSGVAASEQERPADQGGPARRRCDQTSMQLAIAAAQDTKVTVKSVEVLDDKGVSLGVLAATSPTRWSDTGAKYETWNESVAAGQTAQVSYVLQQPSFVSHDEPRDRTYTVKVVAAVGGVDQPLQTTVMVVARRPAVPT